MSPLVRVAGAALAVATTTAGILQLAGFLDNPMLLSALLLGLTAVLAANHYAS